MRHLGRGKAVRLEKWTGTYGGYREFDGYRLPTNFESTWNLKSGDLTFAKFAVDTITIDEVFPENVSRSAGRQATGGARD